MHEPVLVHADVDEGAEVRHVGHDAGADHAGLEVLQSMDVVAKGEGDEAGARIAAGLFQLLDDVVEGERASGLELLAQRALPPELGEVPAAERGQRAEICLISSLNVLKKLTRRP